MILARQCRGSAPAPSYTSKEKSPAIRWKPPPRSLKVALFMKHETVGTVAEGSRVNSPDCFDAARGVELQKRRTDVLHILEVVNLLTNLDGHGRAAHHDEDLCRRRLHHDVRADSLDSLGGFLQHARSESHNDNDESNFNGDGNHANQWSQGPMQQIAVDLLAHHGR